MGQIRDAIDEFKVVRKFGKCDYINKIIGFVHVNIMKVKKTRKSQSPGFLATFIDNSKGLIYNKTNIHHSHIMGEVMGYSHIFCNLKVKENRDKVSAIAHNLFYFDFFFPGVRE